MAPASRRSIPATGSRAAAAARQTGPTGGGGAWARAAPGRLEAPPAPPTAGAQKKNLAALQPRLCRSRRGGATEAWATDAAAATAVDSGGPMAAPIRCHTWPQRHRPKRAVGRAPPDRGAADPGRDPNRWHEPEKKYPTRSVHKPLPPLQAACGPASTCVLGGASRLLTLAGVDRRLVVGYAGRAPSATGWCGARPFWLMTATSRGRGKAGGFPVQTARRRAAVARGGVSATNAECLEKTAKNDATGRPLEGAPRECIDAARWWVARGGGGVGARLSRSVCRVGCGVRGSACHRRPPPVALAGRPRPACVRVRLRRVRCTAVRLTDRPTDAAAAPAPPHALRRWPCGARAYVGL